jgi:hypothetical protein
MSGRQELMNMALRVAVICGLTALAQSHLPWWSCAVVAFITEALLARSGRFGFFSGFYGVALAWMAMAFYIDRTTESVLTYRLLELFKLPMSATVMVIITGMVGGITGGLASLAGNWTRTAFIDGK